MGSGELFEGGPISDVTLFCLGECTFEETNPPLCGWVNVRGRDQIDWTRATGRTSSIGTGPSNDHTYGNSKGMFTPIIT